MLLLSSYLYEKNITSNIPSLRVNIRFKWTIRYLGLGSIIRCKALRFRYRWHLVFRAIYRLYKGNIRQMGPDFPFFVSFVLPRFPLEKGEFNDILGSAFSCNYAKFSNISCY